MGKLRGGVAQGSVLGPILFLLMINDLPDALINKTYLFADDISVVFFHKPDRDITAEMNAEIRRLQLWADSW